MKRYKLLMTEFAEQDFEDVGDYIAYELREYANARKTVAGIRKEIRSLSNLPERNELDEDIELAKLGVRRHYYKSYKIYYMIIEQDNCVLILRILHMLVDSRSKVYRVFGIQ